MSNANPMAAIAHTSQPVSESLPPALRSLLPCLRLLGVLRPGPPGRSSGKVTAAAPTPPRAARPSAYCGPIDGGHFARKSRGPRVV
jgi:hypothetical protein